MSSNFLQNIKDKIMANDNPVEEYSAMHQGEILPSISKKDLKRYERLREGSKALIKLLGKKTHKSIIKESAKRLGMWRKGGISANNVHDLSILLDYCFFHYLVNDSTVINRCFDNGSIDLCEGAEELKIFNNAFFAIIRFKAKTENYGVIVTDVLRNKNHVLIDKALSLTFTEGGLMLSNLIPFNNYIMTSGAGLPLLKEHKQKVMDIFGAAISNNGGMDNIPRAKLSLIIGKALKILLRADITNHVEYI